VTAYDLTVLDLLDALLRIDSVNPGLDPGGAGEAQIAAFVAGWGRAAGLRTQVLEGTPGRPSVILRGGQNTGGRRLLLCGHLDTVGLAGTRDALTRLDPAGIDAAVVTEPTERQAGTAHRGFVWSEVTITGVAAHGSRPHLGADAILAAGHHLVAFDHLDHQLRGRPHPFLGPGNLHASLITGGTEESTIPGRCVFTVERRTLPEETLERVEADVADLLERCRPADPRLNITARTLLNRPPMETPATAPIVQALLAAAGPGTTVAPMSYWADSAFLAAAGIPTVLYGPEGEGAHADIEWVSRSGTTTTTAVLTQLAQDFCS
jgi:acetylornithine deacetylase